MWVGTSRGDLEVQQGPTHPCWRTSPWHFAAPLTPRWPEPLLPSALDGCAGHTAPTHRCLKVAATVQITLFIIITRSGVCVLSCFSRVWLFATLWAAALQAHLSLGFSRQEYWSGVPFPPPGDPPDPGIEPPSLASPALAEGLFTTSATWEAQIWGILSMR